MNALLYLYKTTFKNRVLRALRKPVTYIYAVIAIFYIVIMVNWFVNFAGDLKMDSPEGLVSILSLVTFFFMPMTLISYAKRKGIVFRPGDVHFVFPSPTNPKMILLFTQIKQYALGLFIYLAVSILGVFFFGVPPFSMFLYFILAYLVENILEGSLVVLLYGNETLSERTIKICARLIWLIVIALVSFAVYLYFTGEHSLNIVMTFMAHPVVQCVPIVGWNIAFIRLLLLGPTTVNVICTILYCLSAVVLFLMARKMTCTGGYYEDAAKFADDYQEMMVKKKKGEASQIGAKKKFRTAKVAYKGSYAKAIFYRQLLEYKKSKYFIFDINTLFCLIGGILLAIICNTMKGNDIERFGRYIVPGVAAYLTFCLSGYQTKWAKEMENPYTYLLPDSPLRKLWYATLMEHVRSLIDGCLLSIPTVVILKYSPVMAILYVLIYLCLQANKLYFNVVSEVLIGNVLGSMGKQVFRMFGQMTVIGFAVGICAMVTIFAGVEFGFLALILYTIVVTGAIAVGASFAFARMELQD